MRKKSGTPNRPQLFAQFQKKFGSADGILYAQITRNNTLLTLTDPAGDVLTWTSCKNCGFKGSQKSTAIATITTAQEIGYRILDLKLTQVHIIFTGSSRFRNALFRGFRRAKFRIAGLVIKNKVPYNGCRRKKKRRI